MGVSIYSYCVPIGFSGRAGVDVITARVFPQAVPVVNIMIGGGAGGEEVRDEDRCEIRLLFA